MIITFGYLEVTGDMIKGSREKPDWNGLEKTVKLESENYGYRQL